MKTKIDISHDFEYEDPATRKEHQFMMTFVMGISFTAICILVIIVFFLSDYVVEHKIQNEVTALAVGMLILVALCCIVYLWCDQTEVARYNFIRAVKLKVAEFRRYCNRIIKFRG